ncbi:MAG: hypothetical protein WBW16_03730 [Bacteroidota bacterium]
MTQALMSLNVSARVKLHKKTEITKEPLAYEFCLRREHRNREDLQTLVNEEYSKTKSNSARLSADQPSIFKVSFLSGTAEVPSQMCS